MLQALGTAKNKLSKYYTATDTESYGTIYALATILYPSKKLRYFDNADWRGENIDWMKHYRDLLQTEFIRYEQEVISINKPDNTQASTVPAEDEELAILCDSQTPLQAEVDQPEDEITRYLAKGLTKGNPRVYWKEHEDEFPVLARMAQDIFSIPASGAGVERLFNCARDICHYRRGQLKPETIKDLMLHLFSSKLELEQSQLEMIKEYLSPEEAAMLDQTRTPFLLSDKLEPISDNEEEGCQQEYILDHDSENGSGDELTSMQAVAQGKQAEQKQSQKRTSEALDDADHGLPLPEIPIEEGTQARSGRIRKKPRLPAGFEIDRL